MTTLVTTAAEAAARDAIAIAQLGADGLPSDALMQRAGAEAARLIRQLAQQHALSEVAIYAGPGNNGGDAWVVAEHLRAAGLRVRVHALGAPRTDDARAAHTRAVAHGAFEPPAGVEPLVVDGLLGTGATGAPRDAVAAALALVRAAHERGAIIVALDVPSGLDATTGDDHGAVPAHLTLTFDTLKRGLVVRRDLAGRTLVLDIGIDPAVVPQGSALLLLDQAVVRASIPRITATAHKGTRGRVAIVGGAAGMAGAPIIAAHGALRSGAGLVTCVVAPESRSAVHAAVPYAIALTWDEPLPASDVVVLGPGLGAIRRARIAQWVATSSPRTVLVLDADALNAYAGDMAALRALIGEHRAILTPHPTECARLLGVSTADVLRDRFTIGQQLAAATNAVVILKGTPTVISAPNGEILVAPVGSPVLATGGSGDLLAGILGSLAAVMPSAWLAAQAAVWAHGAAAERAATSPIRGVTLADVEHELPFVWHAPPPGLELGVFAELPFVGE
jgi:NAD(P)H-hydrate epimerase